MSLNYRREDELENTLASARARYDSNEIKNLETEIQIKNMKEKIKKEHIQDEADMVEKEQNMHMENLRNMLDGNEKELYLQSKFGEIEKKYKAGIQPIDITIGNSDITKQIEAEHAERYIDIKNENVKKNIDTIQKISKQLAERTKERIYAVIGSDGSIHLVNDIDTGHYIISKNILENGDILSFIKDIGGKKSRGADRIENLNNIQDILENQEKTGKDQILQVRDNTPLQKSEDKTDGENEIKMQASKNKLQNNEQIEIKELQDICNEPIMGSKNMQVIPFNNLELLLKTNNLLEGSKTEAYKKLIEKGFILGQGEPRIYNGARRGGENAVHLGIDYMVKSGNNVGATYDGEIVNIETPTPEMGGHNGGGYGNMLMIKHILPNGKKFYSLYGHISPTKTFKLGDKVKKGEIIAKVAESFSAASGGRPSHLHFMLIQEGGTEGGYGNIEETNKLIDPLKVFPSPTKETNEDKEEAKEAPITDILDQYPLKPKGKTWLVENFGKIEKFCKEKYPNEGVKVMEITRGDLNQKVEQFYDIIKGYITDDSEEKVKTTIKNIIIGTRTIATDRKDPTGEYDFIVVGGDGAIHFLNDIDTGYWILPSKTLSKVDIKDLITIDQSGSAGIARGEKITELSEISGKEKLLHIGGVDNFGENKLAA